MKFALVYMADKPWKLLYQRGGNREKCGEDARTSAGGESSSPVSEVIPLILLSADCGGGTDGANLLTRRQMSRVFSGREIESHLNGVVENFWRSLQPRRRRVGDFQ